MNILDFFPPDKTPRPQQRELLLALEEAWDTHDVFLLNAPVSVGKSAVAVTISRWATAKRLTSSILTKDKMLVRQYQDDYAEIPSLCGAFDYKCATYGTVYKAKIRTKKDWKAHREFDHCSGCQAFHAAVNEAKRLKKEPGPFLCNMHVHLANRLYKKCLIVDEAHNLVPFLQELHTKKIWRHQHHFPGNCWSREDFKKWVEEKNPRLPTLKAELQRETPRFSLVREVAPYRGRQEELLRLVPFDVRGEAPFMWPGKGTKLVFLSATINGKDLERIGLEDRRWMQIEVDSAIEPERRPIYLDCVASMSYRNQKKNTQLLLDFVEHLWHYYDRARGIVHVPYSVGKLMKAAGSSSKVPMMFHDQATKRGQFQRWLQSDSGILVASGMSEGLDLVGDKARWQVIGKVPWPSLGDPVIVEWAKRDHAAYVWETLKQVIQTSGRVCRTPTDFGATHIFDTDIIRLLEQAEDNDLLPDWWNIAIRGEEEEWLPILTGT